MNLQPPASPLAGAFVARPLPWRIALVSLATLAAGGCASPTRFGVDAIRETHASGPRQSYQLVDTRPTSAAHAIRFTRVARDVETALSSRGMFAAPPGSVPDIEVEIDFGISAPITKAAIRREPVFAMVPGLEAAGAHPAFGEQRIAQASYLGERAIPFTIVSYRKFLRLTAWEAAAGTVDRPRRQVWSVLVTNEDSSRDLPRYVRLMIAAAMDHIDTDSPDVRQVVMTRHDGRIAFIERGMDSS